MRVISETGMRDRVCLRGWLEKHGLLRQYQQAGCYLNLSSYEGMPNTVLEVMACGLPVIVSDIESHQSVIEYLITGCLVDLAGPELPISLLKELSVNRSKLHQMDAAGCERILARHLWEAVAEEHLASLPLVH